MNCANPSCRATAEKGNIYCTNCKFKHNVGVFHEAVEGLVNKTKRLDDIVIKPQELLTNDYVLAAGDINITSQDGKIVLTQRIGKVYNKLCEIDLEQAFALSIAIKAVAACVKHSKG